MKSFITFGIVCLASLAHSLVVRDASGLDLVLSSKSKSQVQIAVTNRGKDAVNILSVDNFFSKNSAVEKVKVYSNGKKVGFSGIRPMVSADKLTKDQFTLLNPGQTMNVEVDPAENHDLRAGGSFDVVAEGLFTFADAGSTIPSAKLLPFSSNKITIQVDKAQAAKSFKDAGRPLSHTKRTTFYNCQNDQHYAQMRNTTLREVTVSAFVAGQAARYGSANKFNYFFKTTDPAVRERVAQHYDAIAKASESPEGNGSAPNIDCDEPGFSSWCSDSGYDGYLAVCEDARLSAVVFCPLYFTRPTVSETCKDVGTQTQQLGGFLSRSGLMLQALANMPEVYEPTAHYHTPYLKPALALSSEQALDNYPSYDFYATSVRYGCFYDGPL